MIKSLLSMGRAASAQALKKRKDSILNSFNTMLTELKDLMEQQEIALEELESQMQVLQAEQKLITAMQTSTAKTVEKLEELVS